MKLQSKLLVAGLALAFCIMVAGYSYIFYLDGDLNNLVEECEQEPNVGSSGFRLLCDPEELNRVPESPGFQGDIFKLNRRINSIQETIWIIAIGIVFLFSIPWLWYFLLQRIRELSNAVMGREK